MRRLREADSTERHLDAALYHAGACAAAGQPVRSGLSLRARSEIAATSASACSGA
jgi:hypothetical protein